MVDIEKPEQFIREYLINIISQFDLKENFTYIDNTQIEDYITQIQIKDTYTLNLVKTKKQHGGGLCGFHCLFNSIHFIKFIKSKGNEAKRLYYLKKMNSGPHFWSFYKKTLKYLLENSNIGESDKSSLRFLGPLERYQFKILMETKPDIVKKVSDDENTVIKYFPFFFAFSFVQMDKNEVINFQQSLVEFRNYTGEKNLVYIILLGVTNHWSVLVIENQNGVIKFNYLDSTNLFNVFNLKTSDTVSEYLNFLKNTKDTKNDVNDLISNDEDIENYANLFISEIAKYRKAPTGWFKTCFTKWLSDINIAIKILFKIVYENYSLYDVIIESLLIRLTNTFEEYNTCILDRSAIDELIIDTKTGNLIKGKLNNWLVVEYHPRILDADLFRGIEIYNNVESVKKMKVYEKFKNLIYYCEVIRPYVNNKDLDNNQVIDRFYIVLEKIENKLI